MHVVKLNSRAANLHPLVCQRRPWRRRTLGAVKGDFATSCSQLVPAGVRYRCIHWKDMPGLRDLTDRIHALGAKISVQLQHAGKVATKDLSEGRPLSVPSANVAAIEGVLNDLTADETAAIVESYAKVDPNNMFREMYEREILRIIQCFADAAEGCETGRLRCRRNSRRARLPRPRVSLAPLQLPHRPLGRPARKPRPVPVRSAA